MQAAASSHPIHPLTYIALLLALTAPIIQMAFRPLLESLFSGDVARFVSSLIMWVITLLILWIARRFEGQSLATFGIRRPDFSTEAARIRFIRELVLAVVIGGVVVFIVVPLSMFGRAWITGSEPSMTGNITSFPAWWVLIFAYFTGIITEEIQFRSYPIERLIQLTGNRWLAGIVTWAIFTALHLLGWDWIHVLTVVAPAGLLLTLTYMWRRSLWFNIVIHGMGNLPLLMLGIAGMFGITIPT